MKTLLHSIGSSFKSIVNRDEKLVNRNGKLKGNPDVVCTATCEDQTRSHQSEDKGHLLKFTGTCTQAEFDARCGETKGWYHAFHFDNGFTKEGDYNIGRDVADYGFPKDMKGMSVLDVGTGSGWFSCYFEQQGASVTTIDVRGLCDHDVFGRPGYPDVSTEKPHPELILSDGSPVYFSDCSQAFWILKDILGLKTKFLNSRIYDLSPELFGGKTFDLVFIGSVLMHVRDPIGALMAARSVCHNQLIATSWDLPKADQSGAVEAPEMRLLTDIAPVYWWQPNRKCLKMWFEGAGFRSIDVDRTINVTGGKPVRSDELQAQSHTQTLIHARV